MPQVVLQGGAVILRQGLVEVFTGEGRGKTSAALGVAMRALGHGLRVHVVFFLKGGLDYGEQEALAHLEHISWARFGREGFVDSQTPSSKDTEEAEKALAEARRAVISGNYDLVVLDEVNVALTLGLIPLGAVLSLLRERPSGVELILTGRGAPREVIEAADLVTEMLAIKHPYARGIEARAGIDY